VTKILAAATLVLTVTFATFTPADAAVTNCTSSVGSSSFSGKCFATTANPPYTTRYAIVGKCKTGTSSVYASGPWKTVGQSGSSVAYCPAGWSAVAGTQYFLFS
jgi:hypothetical protein